MVAPSSGAWIEIVCDYVQRGDILVAPSSGAWIEMQEHKQQLTRLRGVAPSSGAWIEIKFGGGVCHP